MNKKETKASALFDTPLNRRATKALKDFEEVVDALEGIWRENCNSLWRINAVS